MRDRVTAETAEEREARLQCMRDTRAAESAEKREARLQQMMALQQLVIAYTQINNYDYNNIIGMAE